MKAEINLGEVGLFLKPILISFLVKFDGPFRKKKKTEGGLEHTLIKAVPPTCYGRKADSLPTALLHCV